MPTEAEQRQSRVAGATALLAVGNIASRVLGLVREQVLTYLFGASAAVDAFQVAIIAPRAAYDLLIGGHVNGAIVPVLTDLRANKAELWRVLGLLAGLVMALLTGLALLMMAFAPQVVRLAAEGADASTQALAVALLRLTAPGLIFLGLFAVFSGALIALERFIWPAFATVVFNGCIALVTVLLAPPQQVMLAGPGDIYAPVLIARPADGIAAAAIGWLIATVAQFALQLYGLGRARTDGPRLRLRLGWRQPALRQIGRLYVPVLAGLLLDTLIVRFFTYNLATQTGIEGAIGYMVWATTLIQFPQGLVATAISLAVLPMLSQAANALDDFRATLGLGLRLTLGLILPAAVGVFVLAVPLVRLLFEHGAFTAADTEIVATATRLYLLGLPFAAVDLLLVYAFYARKDTLTPALIGVVSHVVYMVTLLLLIEPLSLYALMIADAIKHVVHALLSAIILGLRLRGYGRQGILATGLRAGIAAAVMGAVGVGLLPPLTAFIGGGGILREAVGVGVAAAIMGAVFLALAWLLRIQELRWLVTRVRQRLGR